MPSVPDDGVAFASESEGRHVRLDLRAQPTFILSGVQVESRESSRESAGHRTTPPLCPLAQTRPPSVKKVAGCYSSGRQAIAYSSCHSFIHEYSHAYGQPARIRIKAVVRRFWLADCHLLWGWGGVNHDQRESSSERYSSVDAKNQNNTTIKYNATTTHSRGTPRRRRKSP